MYRSQLTFECLEDHARRLHATIYSDDRHEAIRKAALDVRGLATEHELEVRLMSLGRPALRHRLLSGSAPDFAQVAKLKRNRSHVFADRRLVPLHELRCPERERRDRRTTGRSQAMVSSLQYRQSALCAGRYNSLGVEPAHPSHLTGLIVSRCLRPSFQRRTSIVISES